MRVSFYQCPYTRNVIRMAKKLQPQALALQDSGGILTDILKTQNFNEVPQILTHETQYIAFYILSNIVLRWACRTLRVKTPNPQLLVFIFGMINAFM